MSSESDYTRKRRRLESTDHSQISKYNLEGKYSDAYRELFNEDVNRTAIRFNANDNSQPFNTQIGASTWTSKEQAVFFAALERLGGDDIPGVARAVATKSIPETHELLLLLRDAAAKQGDAKVTLRDIPAAIEVGNDCNAQLDLAGEALAWYQEIFEADQEQGKFGDYWLITPAIAGKIEEAIAGRTRASSTPLASEPELPRKGGNMIAGSCSWCKQSKQKCDRGTPCGNCVRRRNIATCVYKETPTKSKLPDQEDAPARAVETTDAHILEAIPEASLLQPHVMLTLSATLFMNRSPTLPSPWPHWSEYTSELAKGPAIYRSAFNDLHTLVASITRRLVQTAIVQATSRLRSQRRRVKKGTLPLVRRRDVFAAIDTLGLKRNGRERWRGVARRCSVRVFDGKRDFNQNSNHRREVSWDEVERILASIEPSTEPLTTDVETSADGGEAFSTRAARSGTPLPMEQLTLSDSDEGLGSDDSDAASQESQLDETQQPTTRPTPQPRDPFGRYTSVPPMLATGAPESHLCTLEQFDQEASRQEEQTLWRMLGLEPSVKNDYTEIDEDDEDICSDYTEKVITNPDNWRAWTDYHAEWEEFHTPVPIAKLVANVKPDTHVSRAQTRSSYITDAGSGDDTDTSAVEGAGKDRRQASTGIELRARGAQAYAALQERAFEPYEHDPVSGSSESEGDGTEADVPVQSIEDGSQSEDFATSEDEMNWEA